MKVRAVIFEDAELVRNLIASFLRIRGYEVLAYENPTECSIDAANPADGVIADILITDNTMPEMNGIEFLEMLIETKKEPLFTSWAIMSGSLEQSDYERAEKLDCTIFSKPFQQDVLKQWLDECESNIDPSRKLLPIPVPAL